MLLSPCRRRRFRSADAGPIRDKKSPCHHCLAAPDEGEHFPVCRGCHMVAFCGKACQQAAWPSHRSMCDYYYALRRETRRAVDADPDVASQQAAQGVPPLEVRAELFRDFIELYTYTAQWALYAALREEHGENTDDYNRTLLTIYLTYRGDCNGDPSRAYYVTGAGLTYVGGGVAPLPPGVDSQKPPVGCIRVERDTTISQFPAVSWSTDDGMALMPLVRLGTSASPPSHPSMLDGVDDKWWLFYLQETISEGLVFRAPRRGSGNHMLLGRLEKSGSGWRWRPLRTSARAPREDSD
ncbi:uncharacterized protein C8Q71DRAFT_850059 [Rhodofomes roseus]|uniref:MYND-type domain-containing protein n=1 Tax=Rhodofomes roseus TaxID=34475 RepID=A0ABQ8K750_9APHY|nr:uncharacterized protein C8Q71DRAFT_850059 [Rhodofomes roseus]KAH9832867.1 hypothetical protein C8Q71DRAFT_850059 [Rhodofomes roseus]